ncbi:hypothetical protein LCGC14_1939060 [marine sediment metagenome]|uniref:Uncharacterized protein n=1 Tax=marine sediment metagenome TaxID=412755 RepID=A0A0F9FKT0_9ZZZZ
MTTEIEFEGSCHPPGQENPPADPSHVRRPDNRVGYVRASESPLRSPEGATERQQGQAADEEQAPDTAEACMK